MPRLFHIQNSFNGGELSPFVLGRTDLAKYRNGCESLVNFIPLLAGGVVRRPGTRFIVNAANQAAASRLIKFEFSLNKSFVLEFGNKTLRFYTAGAQIQAAGGGAYQIATPYDTTVDDLWDIKFAQQGNLMYLVHPNHPPQKLTRIADNNWTLTQPAFGPAPAHDYDQDVSAGTITLTPGALTGTGVTFTASAAVFLAADIGRLIVSGSSAARITSVTSGTQVVADIVNPFLSLVAIAAGQWFLRGGLSAFAALVSLGYSDTTAWFNQHNLGLNVLSDLYLLTVFPIDSNGRTAQAWPAQVAGFRASDVGRFVVFGGMVYVITSFATSSHVVVRSLGVIKTTASDLLGTPMVQPQSQGTWHLEFAAWDAVNLYPQAVAFYQDRLVFAGSAGLPQHVWASVTSDFENFAKGSGDTDALDFGINSGSLETIVSATEFRGNLALLTLRTQYVVGGGSVQFGSASQALTPRNIVPVRQSTFGTDRVQPIIVDEDLIYIKRSKTAAGVIGFDVQQSLYNTRNITILNEVIASTGFKELVYQQYPNRVVWATTLDGGLVGLTYERENDVWAWHRHQTGVDAADQIVSVAVVPQTPPSLNDDLYLLTKRTINGVVTYMIELSDPTLYVDAASQATFGAAVTQVGNLAYLNGRTVAGNADGAAQPSAVMGAAGTYNLEPGYSAKNVQVGLPFTSSLTTTRFEIAAFGTIQGLLGRFNRLWARVYNTVGLVIDGTRVVFRQTSDQIGQAPASFTGDVMIEGNADYDRDKRITIAQDQPLPATVLAVFGTISVGEN